MAPSSASLYGCTGLEKSCAAAAALDDPTGVHDVDRVAERRGEPEIVGDQDHARGPRSSTSAPSRSTMRACVVTSSAVVGSSAIRTSGFARDRHRDHHALTHPAGELVRIAVEAARGLRRCRRRRAARSHGLAPAPWGRRSWARIASTIWRPMERTGLSEDIGSWYTIAIRPPRTAAISRSVSCVRSRPPSRTVPAAIRPGGGSSRISASAVSDFPDPDSPTRPTFSRRPTLNATSITGLTARRGERELDREAANLQHRAVGRRVAHRRAGSSARWMLSPSTFSESTAITITRPGKIGYQYDL